VASRASKSSPKKPSKTASSRSLTVRRGLGTGGGRAIGTPNKVSAQAKDNIVEVFVKLGGVPAMVTWAKKNKDTFYTKLYARLIPKDLSVSADAGLEELLTKLAERRGTEIADGDYTEISAEQPSD
jgi:hypothetical protein